MIEGPVQHMAGWMSEVLVSILRRVRFPHKKDILVGTRRPAAQAAATYVRDNRHCLAEHGLKFPAARGRVIIPTTLPNM